MNLNAGYRKEISEADSPPPSSQRKRLRRGSFMFGAGLSNAHTKLLNIVTLAGKTSLHTLSIGVYCPKPGKLPHSYCGLQRTRPVRKIFVPCRPVAFRALRSAVVRCTA